MKRRTLLHSLPALAFLPAAAWLTSDQEKSGSGQSSTPIYELRVYHSYEGKLDDLLSRFREHTMKLFEKHGMKNVAYWTPTEEPLKGKTLVYILAHPSRDAAAVNWKAFGDRSEEHTSELQSHHELVCRLLLETKKCRSCPFVTISHPRSARGASNSGSALRVFHARV